MSSVSDADLRKLSYNELIDLVKYHHERHRRSLTEEVDEELAHLAGPDEDNEHLMHGAMPVDDVFHTSEDERRQQKTTKQQQAKGESATKGNKRHGENNKHTQKEQDSRPRQQEAQSQQSQSAGQRRRPLALPQTPKTQSRTVRHPPTSSNPLARVLQPRRLRLHLHPKKRKNYTVVNPDLPQQITIKLRDLDGPLHCKRVRFDPSGTACENIIEQTWGGDTSKLVTWYAGEKTIATGMQRAALVAQAAGELPAMPCTLTEGTKTPRKADKPIDKAMAKFEAETNDINKSLAAMRHDLKNAKYINWPEGYKDPAKLCSECELVLEYFNTYNAMYAEINERGDCLHDNLHRIAEICNAMAALPFAVEAEEADVDDNDNERQSRQNRNRSRRNCEEEVEKTPGPRKRTIVHISDDDDEE
ncbi:hypothetical protein KEM55_003150 [Ascosphaera atra]|nr:hypothetical protein KEM55_003150 [Ascosphaera atra]